MQRLRIRFSRGEEVKFISHLDLMRMWQRVMQRADIPLAYSEGFNPHPRLALAAPLPVGVTAQSELMDIVCTRWVISRAKPSASNSMVISVETATLVLPSRAAVCWSPPSGPTLMVRACSCGCGNRPAVTSRAE